MKEQWKNPCSTGGTRLDFGHLGGTSTAGDRDSWCPELWEWLVDTYRCTSMFDVGCGVGYAMRFFHQLGLEVYGIDCVQVLEHHLLNTEKRVPHPDYVDCHDLTEGPYLYHETQPKSDLVWCCEVAEHVPATQTENVLRTVAENCGKVLAFCAAPAGAGGYQHVRCENPPFWVDALARHGMVYDPAATEQAKSLCKEGNGRSHANYFLRSGLIFTKGAG